MTTLHRQTGMDVLTYLDMRRGDVKDHYYMHRLVYRPGDRWNAATDVRYRIRDVHTLGDPLHPDEVY